MGNRKTISQRERTQIVESNFFVTSIRIQ